MAAALAYANQCERRPAGLQLQQMFNTLTMKPTRALLLYRVPGHGRGKERREPETFVVKSCPFCGKPTGVEKELAGVSVKKNGEKP